MNYNKQCREEVKIIRTEKRCKEKEERHETIRVVVEILSLIITILTFLFK